VAIKQPADLDHLEITTAEEEAMSHQL